MVCRGYDIRSLKLHGRLIDVNPGLSYKLSRVNVYSRRDHHAQVSSLILILLLYNFDIS